MLCYDFQRADRPRSTAPRLQPQPGPPGSPREGRPRACLRQPAANDAAHRPVNGHGGHGEPPPTAEEPRKKKLRGEGGGKRSRPGRTPGSERAAVSAHQRAGGGAGPRPAAPRGKRQRPSPRPAPPTLTFIDRAALASEPEPPRRARPGAPRGSAALSRSAPPPRPPPRPLPSCPGG